MRLLLYELVLVFVTEWCRCFFELELMFINETSMTRIALIDY